jgi:uncharacterized protein YjbI with pentapeptide repeats
VLAALAWPTIKKPLGFAAVNPNRLWVAVIVAATFVVVCSLVYFVAKKSLWDFLDLLIVPLALAIIGFGFTVQQQARQTQIENQRDVRAQAVEEQRAQNEALQAYLDQMSHLMLEKDLLRSDVGDSVFTLARARTTTAISQLDGEHNQAVTRFLSDSGLLKDPALLANADLEDAELPKAMLQDAELPKAMLQDANLAGTQLNRANLTGAVLLGAVFSAAEKGGGDTNLITADLTKTDLSKAALQGANLAHCTLDKATLTNAALQRAQLNSASLRGADLSDAALQDADLSSAYLSGADLQEDVPLFAFKKEATNLTDAKLIHAALQDANLSSTYLSGADLTDADLADADLADAYLSDANLTGAKGWTEEQLTAARSLEGTTMPDGQTLKSDKMPQGPTFEEWLKDKEGRGKNRENRGSS